MYKKYEALLKKYKVTTAEVSAATGIAQTVFSNWKKRGGCLSAKNLKKLADYFGVKIEDLLEG